VDVAIAGGHGQVARRLARLLVERGDTVFGLIRKREHVEDLRADGSEPVLIDMEAAGPEEIAEAIRGADAVVFAAGAGPGSGAERKLTVDRDGAIKLLDAARSAGVQRYVIVSSVGAESPPGDDDVFTAFTMGAALARSGFPEQAERMLGAARALDPEFRAGEIDLELGRMRLARRDPAGAREALEGLPESPLRHLRRGLVGPRLRRQSGCEAVLCQQFAELRVGRVTGTLFVCWHSRTHKMSSINSQSLPARPIRRLSPPSLPVRYLPVTARWPKRAGTYVLLSDLTYVAERIGGTNPQFGGGAWAV